jgi:hypothetical protein
MNVTDSQLKNLIKIASNLYGKQFTRAVPQLQYFDTGSSGTSFQVKLPQFSFLYAINILYNTSSLSACYLAFYDQDFTRQSYYQTFTGTTSLALNKEFPLIFIDDNFFPYVSDLNLNYTSGVRTTGVLKYITFIE